MGAADRAGRVGDRGRDRRADRDERRRHVHAADDQADRQTDRRNDQHRRPGAALPRDRRARPAGAPPRDDGRLRPDARALARGGVAPAGRVGARPLVADGRQPGRDPARLERGHPRLPLGRQGVGPRDRLLRPAGLRRDRGGARDRDRPAGQRRLEPRQPAVGRGRRGDPHLQPDERRDAREPRLPRLLRERAQRHQDVRPLLLGGLPRVDGGGPGEAARRASARPPRRPVPVHAGGDVRGRPRPDRLRRDRGHDARPPRRLLDILELRRGRAPLRARARRHARGTAEARPAVRPDRPGAEVRAAAVRDRRPLRPRPDPGRDLQAAERLRPRRARREVARAARPCRRLRAATSRRR